MTLNPGRKNYRDYYPENRLTSNLKELKEASEMMEIPENYLIELASQAPDNCVTQMNVLKNCMQDLGYGKFRKLKSFDSLFTSQDCIFITKLCKGL